MEQAVQTTTETAEMKALKQFNLKAETTGASIISGGSSESKLDEGTYSATLVGGVRPFKTIGPLETEKGTWLINIAKFNVNVGDKTLVQEGTLNVEEWEDDILAGVSLSNQQVEVETKVINGKMRNIISRV